MSFGDTDDVMSNETLLWVVLAVVATGWVFAVLGMHRTWVDRQMVISAGANGMKGLIAEERFLTSIHIMCSQLTLLVGAPLMVMKDRESRGVHCALIIMGIVSALLLRKSCIRRRFRRAVLAYREC